MSRLGSKDEEQCTFSIHRILEATAMAKAEIDVEAVLVFWRYLGRSLWKRVRRTSRRFANCWAYGYSVSAGQHIFMWTTAPADSSVTACRDSKSVKRSSKSTFRRAAVSLCFMGGGVWGPLSLFGDFSVNHSRNSTVPPTFLPPIRPGCPCHSTQMAQGSGLIYPLSNTSV